MPVPEPIRPSGTPVESATGDAVRGADRRA